MFDPVANLASLLSIFLDLVGTTVSAFLLPVTHLIVYPLLSVLQLFL